MPIRLHGYAIYFFNRSLQQCYTTIVASKSSLLFFKYFQVKLVAATKIQTTKSSVEFSGLLLHKQLYSFNRTIIYIARHYPRENHYCLDVIRRVLHRHIIIWKWFAVKFQALLTVNVLNFLYLYSLTVHLWRTEIINNESVFQHYIYQNLFRLDYKNSESSSSGYIYFMIPYDAIPNKICKFHI